MLKKSKIRRLKKAPCLILVLTLTTVIWSVCNVFDAKADDVTCVREMQPITVEKGDTLWNLVQDYYMFSGKISAAIYEVKQINNIKSSLELQPGNIIYIPRE